LIVQVVAVDEPKGYLYFTRCRDAAHDTHLLASASTVAA
jgi:hypothetical protein